MDHDLPKLSVVCPAYQEEEVLPLFHAELAAALAPLQSTFEIEILYIDDGSRDQTLQVIKRLANHDKRVRFISFSRNFGKEAALLAGLEHASGDALVTLDTDLQHPPRLIPQLVRSWQEGNDVVLTIRAEDKRLGVGKRLTSRLFYRLMGWVSDTAIRPAACDFRLLSRRVVDSILRMREQHRFLRGLVQWVGYKTAEIPFEPDARPVGQTKFRWRQLLALASDSMFSFSRLPLRLATYLGLVAVAVGLLFMLGLSVRALSGGTISGWAYVFTALHFFGGCILGALGILGEYVGRIYEEVKQRPLYLLKDRSPALETVHQPTPRSRWRGAA